MLIASYNFSQTGDVLMVVLNQDTTSEMHEQKSDIVRIYDEKTGQTLGFNFFQASTYVPDLNANGQVKLTTKQVAQLNQALLAAGFKPELVVDDKPSFVVGYVEEMTEHPDSDHLSITQTEIDNGEVVQIVCGASNIAEGQKVVVAKVGAIMPNGLVIWDGELRGEPSYGMICSARELELKDAPNEKGILVLPETAVTGEAFKG